MAVEFNLSPARISGLWHASKHLQEKASLIQIAELASNINRKNSLSTKLDSFYNSTDAYKDLLEKALSNFYQTAELGEDMGAALTQGHPVILSGVFRIFNHSLDKIAIISDRNTGLSNVKKGSNYVIGALYGAGMMMKDKKPVLVEAETEVGEMVMKCLADGEIVILKRGSSNEEMA